MNSSIRGNRTEVGRRSRLEQMQLSRIVFYYLIRLVAVHSIWIDTCAVIRINSTCRLAMLHENTSVALVLEYPAGSAPDRPLNVRKSGFARRSLDAIWRCKGYNAWFLFPVIISVATYTYFKVI